MPLTIGSPAVGYVTMPDSDMPEGILTAESGSLDTAVNQISDGARFLSVFGTSLSNIVLDGVMIGGTGGDSPVARMRKIAHMRDQRQTIRLLITHGQRVQLDCRGIIQVAEGTVVKDMFVQYHIDIFRESGGAISFAFASPDSIGGQATSTQDDIARQDMQLGGTARRLASASVTAAYVAAHNAQIAAQAALKVPQAGGAQ